MQHPDVGGDRELAQPFLGAPDRGEARYAHAKRVVAAVLYLIAETPNAVAHEHFRQRRSLPYAVHRITLIMRSEAFCGAAGREVSVSARFGAVALRIIPNDGRAYPS
jgi:hypothetical protein